MIRKYSLITLLLFLFIYRASAQLAEIPFLFSKNRILIKVQSNKSKPLLFIFDTGGTGTLIDSLSAEKAGIKRDEGKNINVIGSGGAQNYAMASHQAVSLAGNVQIKDIELVLMNLSSFSSAVRDTIHGIIGYDVLSRYTTKIDFERHKISLYGSIKSADTIGYVRIPFEFNKGIAIPRFPVSVKLDNNESFTGRVMFDSGADLTLLVSAPFRNFHHFESKMGKTTGSKGRGLNFEKNDENAVIRGMSFNGFNFGPMAIELTKNDQAEAKDGYLGIIGMDIIKRFDVILDYANKNIYLKPNAFYNQPFDATLKAAHSK